MSDAPAFQRIATAAVGAADRGFQAWNYDPYMATVSGNNTSGTVFGSRLRLTRAGVISSVWFAAAGAGVNLVAGNFVGIYSPAGALLAQSADLTAFFGALGSQSPVSCSLTAPIALPAGFYDVAVVLNQSGGIVPQLFRIGTQTGQAKIGVGANGTPLRMWTADTGRTTLPAVLGTKIDKQPAEWLAIA